MRQLPPPKGWIGSTMLNAIADYVLSRITIVGGTAYHGVNSLCLRVGSAAGGSGFFWAKIVTAGPASEADYADARYWVKEQTPTVNSTTLKWTFADTTSGRHVTATNVMELGIGTGEEGAHGILDGVTPPDRYVRVYEENGRYYFETMPCVFSVA